MQKINKRAYYAQNLIIKPIFCIHQETRMTTDKILDEYDGIVLGAGHNGLITQGYMAKAGLKVLSIEQLDRPGGGLRTEEFPEFPGYRHNTHAVFCRAVSSQPWFRDFELEKHGVEMIEPEMNVALLTRDGDALQWWTQFEKTYDSVARFSQKDADSLRRWHEEFFPVVMNVLRPELSSPPLSSDRRQELLSRSVAGRRLLEISKLSPLEFVKKEFSHPIVQAGLLFFNGLREVDMRAKGFGHHVLSLLASPAKAQMPRGGSAELGKGLARAVEAAGGDILLNTSVKRIHVENGRACAVETHDGRYIGARKFIASSLNVQQTFLELMSPEDVPREILEKAYGYQFNLVAPLATVHVRLKEPPRYRAAEKIPSANDAFMVVMGIDDLETYEQMVANHEVGIKPPGPVLYGACQTIHDPTQAPAGKHTAFMWQKVPYHLYGNPDNWDRYGEAIGKEMLDQWKTYAPNLGDAVESMFVTTPRDTVRLLPTMGEGDTIGGGFLNGQYLDGRPWKGANYRGPVKSLYLCGMAVHPGGNITGLPGYNAAQVMLNDMDKPQDWMPVSFEEQLKAYLK
jgi:phytoene dehydrogenase-like protein